MYCGRLALATTLNYTGRVGRAREGKGECSGRMGYVYWLWELAGAGLTPRRSRPSNRSTSFKPNAMTSKAPFTLLGKTAEESFNVSDSSRIQLFKH